MMHYIKFPMYVHISDACTKQIDIADIAIVYI